MKQKPIFIKKNSIDVEPFSTQKLEHSLQRSGASKEDIENIKEALRVELLFLAEFREKVTDHIINQVID